MSCCEASISQTFNIAACGALMSYDYFFLHLDEGMNVFDRGDFECLNETSPINSILGT